MVWSPHTYLCAMLVNVLMWTLVNAVEISRPMKVLTNRSSLYINKNKLITVAYNINKKVYRIFFIAISCKQSALILSIFFFFCLLSFEIVFDI